MVVIDTNAFNRPVGSDPRVIADMLANFDDILAAVNSPGLDAANLADGTLVVDKLSDALKDILGVNDSVQNKRRVFTTFSDPTGIFITNAPGDGVYTNILQNLVVVPTNGIVICCVEYKFGGVGTSGRVDSRIDVDQSTGGPTFPHMVYDPVQTGADKWFPQFGMTVLTNLTAGQRSLMARCTHVTANGVKVRACNFMSIVLDF